MARHTNRQTNHSTPRSHSPTVKNVHVTVRCSLPVPQSPQNQRHSETGPGHSSPQDPSGSCERRRHRHSRCHLMEMWGRRSLRGWHRCSTAISWCPRLTFSLSQTKGNPCPWPLWCIPPSWHEEKERGEICWLGLKRAGMCAHRTPDPWTLTFNRYHEGKELIGNQICEQLILVEWSMKRGVGGVTLIRVVRRRVYQRTEQLRVLTDVFTLVVESYRSNWSKFLWVCCFLLFFFNRASQKYNLKIKNQKNIWKYSVCHFGFLWFYKKGYGVTSFFLSNFRFPPWTKMLKKVLNHICGCRKTHNFKKKNQGNNETVFES